MNSKSLLGGVAFAATIFGVSAASADNLVLYCAADEAWCQQIKTGFEEKTGITVDMTRKSSGETYAQVRAEAALLDKLGVTSVAAAVGGSMGGARALEWAVTYPERTRAALVLAVVPVGPATMPAPAAEGDQGRARQPAGPHPRRRRAAGRGRPRSGGRRSCRCRTKSRRAAPERPPA